MNANLNNAVIILVVVLLTTKELLLAYWGEQFRPRSWLRWLDLALFVLLIAFSVIIALRIEKVLTNA